MWFFGRKRASATPKLLEECLERLKRLEIELVECSTEVQGLRTSHMKLLKRANGELGGRPRADASGEVAAFGDKQALRRQLAGELAARQRGNIPRE